MVLDLKFSLVLCVRCVNNFVFVGLDLDLVLVLVLVLVKAHRKM